MDMREKVNTLKVTTAGSIHQSRWKKIMSTQKIKRRENEKKFGKWEELTDGVVSTSMS
jgi:hypothetical protein